MTGEFKRGFPDGEQPDWDQEAAYRPEELETLRIQPRLEGERASACPQEARSMDAFIYIAGWVFGSLCAGVAAGYFLRHGSPSCRTASVTSHDQPATLKVLNELLDAAQRMSADVESHNSQIATSARDVGTLQVSGELENVKQMLLNHMTGMLTSNKRLQGDLTYTRYQMEEQAQEIDEVRREARTDSLTGVVNRAGFDEKLRFLLAIWEREQQAFVLIMLDLDYFKRINDSHGHPAGDRVLEELGGWLKEWLRETDFVARYGGDEFAVLLPATELSQGMQVAESIRKRTADNAHRIAVRGAKVSVAISIGVAAPSEGDTPESLLERADRALYQAKHAGRNRVCSQDAPPVSVRECCTSDDFQSADAL